MRKLLPGILLISLSCLFNACRTSYSPDVNLLNKATSLVETDPKQALKLIDSIFMPEHKLNKEQYMRYVVTRVQVYYKNYRDISTDILIFKARDYFQAFPSDPFNFLSHFYTGCVYREQQRFDLAILAYKEALSIAKQADNRLNEGLVYYNIGNLYYNQLAYREAWNNYKNAAVKYQGDTTKTLISLEAAGQSALLFGKMDSAMLFFNKAIDLASKTTNRAEKAKSFQSKAVAYYEDAQYQKAIPLLLKARSIDPDSSAVVRYNLNLARTYLAMNKQDSARFYTLHLQKSLPDISDVHLKAAISEFLADLYVDQGNYPLAITYLRVKDSCNLRILQKTNVQQLADAEKKYDLATKASLLSQERARSYRLGLIIAVCGFVIIGITGFGAYLQVKHKRARIEGLRLKQQAASNECLLSVYRNHIGNVATLKDRIENLIIRYTRSGVKDVFDGYEKISQAVNSMDAKMHAGYENFVRDYLNTLSLLSEQQVSQLKLEEQLLLTLLHARCSHMEIARLLQIKKHALTTRKARLREKLEKIGVKENCLINIFNPTLS